MKKVFFLFVLSLGLFSFTNKDSVSNIDDAILVQTCCTATVTYNGEYHSSYTACVPGEGRNASMLACAAAGSQAQAYINQQ